MSFPRAIDADAPVIAHHTIDIQAPLEVVWNLHVDVTGWTGWNSDMTSARLDDPFAPGSTFDWESYGFPVTSTIYVVEPRHRILWGGVAAGITGVHEWLFSNTERGVRVETSESFAGAPVVNDVAAMTSMLDTSLDAWLKQLKGTSEQRAAM